MVEVELGHIDLSSHQGEQAVGLQLKGAKVHEISEVGLESREPMLSLRGR